MAGQANNQDGGQAKLLRAILFAVTIASVLLSCGVTTGVLLNRVSQLEKIAESQGQKVDANGDSISFNASVIKVINTKLDYITKGIDELKKDKK